MYETVFLAYLVEYRLLGKKLRFHYWLPLFKFQLRVTTIWKRHQVPMVLVSATCKRCVELANIQSVEHTLLHISGHVLVVNHAYGFAALTRINAQGNLLHSAIIRVVVNLHLGILSKLKRVGLVSRRLCADEDKWQTEADNIVKVHNIIESIRLWNAYKSAVHTIGHLDDGIFHLMVTIGMRLLNNKVYAVVLQCVEVVYCVKPDRIGRAVEFVVIKTLQKLFLLVVQLRLLKRTYMMLLKLGEHLLYSLCVF